MICDRMREQIPEFLEGRLEGAAREKMVDHLDTCSACRAEVAQLGEVWRGLEAMSEPEPGQGMRTQFLATLNAYQEGYEDAQRRQALTKKESGFWAGWWPARPVWQAAFSAVLVLAGALGGRYMLEPRGSQARVSEMAQLQGQVENLRQLVALSLLNQSSPSARLRGVTYSNQMTHPDQQVEQALLYAVTHDGNVNVRLSAVDALAKFMGDPQVRRAVVDSIPVQDSPLVQVSLIDLMTQVGNRDAIPVLRKLTQDLAVDDAVRQRAASALTKLGEAR
jgi:hypothetical protein